MAEEHMTLRDLGFDFGPDPFGDKALVAKASAIFHSTELAIALGLIGLCVLYWLWVLWRDAGERKDAVVISKGREVQLAGQRAEALKELRGRDARFDEEAFLAHARAIFLRVSDAWSLRRLPLARAFVSDGFYERLSGDVAAQTQAGVRHCMSETTVLEASALGYAAGWHYDSIAVGFKVSAVRSRLDLKTGAALESARETYEEIWTFVRRPSAATLAKPGPIEGFCPSCGSALSISDAARCEACKTWINSGEYDWIAVKSTVPWEWRFPDPRREITGWEELREDDPALSLETLEDRAAVVFWRWLDALRRRDPAPLHGVSTPGFYSELRLDALAPRDALLGAVETVAFEAGPEFDLVHCQVRWENGDERRTDYLVFARRGGATTDWQAGLSTTRCPGCGAPPEAADAESCAYCGQAFNDGSRGWALARIVPFGEWRRPAEAPETGVLPSCEWGEELAAADALGALAACVAADGEVRDRELAYLNAYALRRKVPQEKVDALIDEARAGRLPYAPPEGADDVLLRGLIRMSLADGFIDDGERALLGAAARRAGLHELDLKRMIREERAALAARARELVDRLG
ncbi:MAG: zinc-ribbon domain-containing transport protein [Elusimicrobia bacterium]|nr:zinc-ribbon domain-containing transport protein [Elusimicrobiota bacterium]